MSEQKRKYLGAGMLVDNLRPFMIEAIDRTITEYHENYEQNHYTIAAQKNIKESYLKILDKYIKNE